MLRPILRASLALCAVISALALVFALTGCSSEVSVVKNGTGTVVSKDYGTASVAIVEVPDGDRTVKCAVLIGVNKGGLSCDWDGPE